MTTTEVGTRFPLPAFEGVMGQPTGVCSNPSSPDRPTIAVGTANAQTTRLAGLALNLAAMASLPDIDNKEHHGLSPVSSSCSLMLFPSRGDSTQEEILLPKSPKDSDKEHHGLSPVSSSCSLMFFPSTQEEILLPEFSGARPVVALNRTRATSCPPIPKRASEDEAWKLAFEEARAKLFKDRVKVSAANPKFSPPSGQHLDSEPPMEKELITEFIKKWVSRFWGLRV